MLGLSQLPTLAAYTQQFEYNIIIATGSNPRT